MKTFGVLCIIAALFVAAMGCPESGINIGLANSLTMHNMGDTNIFHLSITRIGDIGGKGGVNLLPAPLEPGQSFKKSGLVDGLYELSVRYDWPPSASGSSSRTLRQSIEGGGNHDWYFTYNQLSNKGIALWTEDGPVFAHSD